MIRIRHNIKGLKYLRTSRDGTWPGLGQAKISQETKSRKHALKT
jgi:hypothetical protein